MLNLHRDKKIVRREPGRDVFGVLGPRCWTGLSMLYCHVLKKGFGIYMIGILGSFSDVVGGFSCMYVHSSCNLLVNIKGLESTFFSLSASDEAAAS